MCTHGCQIKPEMEDKLVFVNTGFPISKWCISMDSFDTFGKDLTQLKYHNLAKLCGKISELVT